MTTRVVVLVSGSGTLLQALLDAVAVGELDARVVGVVSDQPAAPALERARVAGVPAVAHPYARGSDRGAWDAELTRIVAGFEPDLVASAGFMSCWGRVSWPVSGAASSTPIPPCCLASRECTVPVTP